MIDIFSLSVEEMASKIKEGHLSINYNFLLKVYSALSSDQKIKFTKSLDTVVNKVAKTG